MVVLVRLALLVVVAAALALAEQDTTTMTTTTAVTTTTTAATTTATAAATATTTTTAPTTTTAAATTSTTPATSTSSTAASTTTTTTTTPSPTTLPTTTMPAAAPASTATAAASTTTAASAASDDEADDDALSSSSSSYSSSSSSATASSSSSASSLVERMRRTLHELPRTTFSTSGEVGNEFCDKHTDRTSLDYAVECQWTDYAQSLLVWALVGVACALLFAVVYVVVWCGRCCCSACGVYRPSRANCSYQQHDGYPRGDVQWLRVVLVVLALLNIAFGIVAMVGTTRIVDGVVDVPDTLKGVTDAFFELVESTSTQLPTADTSALHAGASVDAQLRALAAKSSRSLEVARDAVDALVDTIDVVSYSSSVLKIFIYVFYGVGFAVSLLAVLAAVFLVWQCACAFNLLAAVLLVSYWLALAGIIAFGIGDADACVDFELVIDDRAYLAHDSWLAAYVRCAHDDPTHDYRTAVRLARDEYRQQACATRESLCTNANANANANTNATSSSFVCGDSTHAHGASASRARGLHDVSATHMCSGTLDLMQLSHDVALAQLNYSTTPAERMINVSDVFSSLGHAMPSTMDEVELRYGELPEQLTDYTDANHVSLIDFLVANASAAAIEGDTYVVVDDARSGANHTNHTAITLQECAVRCANETMRSHAANLVALGELVDHLNGALGAVQALPARGTLRRDDDVVDHNHNNNNNNNDDDDDAAAAAAVHGVEENIAVRDGKLDYCAVVQRVVRSVEHGVCQTAAEGIAFNVLGGFLATCTLLLSIVFSCIATKRFNRSHHIFKHVDDDNESLLANIPEFDID